MSVNNKQEGNQVSPCCCYLTSRLLFGSELQLRTREQVINQDPGASWDTLCACARACVPALMSVFPFNRHFPMRKQENVPMQMVSSTITMAAAEPSVTLIVTITEIAFSSKTDLYLNHQKPTLTFNIKTQVWPSPSLNPLYCHNSPLPQKTPSNWTLNFTI